MVGVGDSADDARVVGSVLAGDALRASANGASYGWRSPDSLVPKSPPDLRARVGAGAQGAMGAGDFLRVGLGSRHGKSPAGVGGAPYGDALLRSVMAKVELRSHRFPSAYRCLSDHRSPTPQYRDMRMR